MVRVRAGEPPDDQDASAVVPSARGWPRWLLLLALTFVAIGLAGLVLARRGRAPVIWQHEFLDEQSYSVGMRALSASERGVVFLLGDTLHRVKPDGTTSASKAPAHDRFDQMSQRATDDVSLAFFQRVDEVSSELRVARLGANGDKKFDLGLGQMRDDTCGTGQLPPDLASHGSLTWVAAAARGTTALLAIDDTGREVLRVDPCACGEKPCCSVEKLYAHADGVVATLLRSATDERELAWLDRSGRTQHVTPGASGWQSAFDGHGAFYQISKGPLRSCPALPSDGLERLVRVDQAGCSFGPPLPAEVFPIGNAFGIGATQRFVYVAIEGRFTPRWLDWLRGLKAGSFYATIHRFTPDGHHLDSRWIYHDRSFGIAALPVRSLFHVVSDEQLVLTLQETDTPRWSVIGLRY